MFKGWKKVAASLCSLAEDNALELNDGQRASLKAIAERLPNNGIIIADEVGMGKTRIATTVTKAVIEAGGRVAILVPPGLGFQWNDELRKSGVRDVPPILRSLWQYLKAWENQANPAPWFEQKAVLISHAFCNWRLGENAEAWRWALLPELYAWWRKLQKGDFPQDYHGNDLLSDDWVRHAAESIANAVNAMSDDHPSRQRMNEFAEQIPWPGALDGGSYARNENLRPALEKSVGLGLGLFDLVIIDEAHKSRGQESGLNRLLEQVVLSSDGARRLAMTATPIELDVSQWQKILKRIGVEDKTANDAIEAYTKAVERVRKLPNDEKARNVFLDASKGEKGFESALGKYLLRRDKREVQSVKDFANCSGSPHNDYRRLSEIAVPTASLPSAWKQAVCAAEALSFVTRGHYDDDGKRLSRGQVEKAKRLRLTLGNGHGISTLMDELQRDKSKKENSTEEQEASLADMEGTGKNVERIEWWNGVISRAFQGNAEQADAAALYEHPAILAAVDVIEDVCTQGEKVLVFGRFTKPMKALVQLLNAREMLRCIYSEKTKFWPQEVLRKDKDVDEEAIVSVALRQLKINKSIPQVKDELLRQYKELEDARKDLRKNLLKNIKTGLDDYTETERVKALFRAFSKSSHEKVGEGESNTQLALVAHIIQEVLGRENSENPSSIARAFESIITAASDNDEGNEDDHGELDPDEAGELWGVFIDRLKEEYGFQEGGFARLMNGNTKQPTRRLLQLAFNREHSHPKVLVAQSVVGREGLNLHEACRTVILLHAEWNPGVVEQQIGRVDRINSLWEKKLNVAIQSGTDLGALSLPRIEIRPVIFQGTYDEHNWKVLMQRWEDLRAQLHGVVVTPSAGEKLPLELVKKINACAPNFSPTQSNPERCC